MSHYPIITIPSVLLAATTVLFACGRVADEERQSTNNDASLNDVDAYGAGPDSRDAALIHETAETSFEDVTDDTVATDTEGMVVWLRMEDPTGVATNSAPSTLSSVKVVVVGGVSGTAEGYVGHGFAFDGSGGLDVLSDDADLLSPPAITIAFWMKALLAERAAGIASKETNGAVLTGYTVAQNSTNGRMVWDTRAETRVVIASDAGTLSGGRWTHVAAVFDGHNSNLFLDGKVVATAAASGALKPNTVPLHVGYSDYGHFQGILDELRVWNRALLADEVCVEAGGKVLSGTCVMPP